MSPMYRAFAAIAVATLGACAHQTAQPIRYGEGAPSHALAEARAFAAAKAHPNAQPRVRPQFPEQAPSPLPPGTKLPAPLHVTRRSAPYADAPHASNVFVERTVYADSPYRSGSRYGYGYGLSYRQPLGFGVGWDPYGYGYGYGSYYPRSRYGYGIGIGLGASVWGSRHYHAPSFGRVDRPSRFAWEGPRHHGGSHSGWRGGGSGLRVRSVDMGSGRRR